ncbi:MAG: hypothetical protein DWQ02_03800 [Bacteroidetes bacterium]|nr:MAG: hypothetical protein DWQ02_03800 [Bacteroidota bacterium]
MFFPFKSLLFFVFSLLLLWSCTQDSSTVETSAEKSQMIITAKADTFLLSKPSAKTLEQFNQAREEYVADKDNADNIIWYGRRTAYLGQYYDAIEIYSDGIQKFPDDPRLYRHRGHRYISVRDFDKAIADLEKAAALIEGTENKIEPDGLPNAQNIPVSSLHGNIWYHLGLAYYLKQDFQRSFDCFMNCRNSGSNDDNIVSSTHWLFMNMLRMEKDSLKDQVLEPIKVEANIIENFSYHQLCQLYKGLLPVDSLQATVAGSPSGDALKYGLATWLYFNDSKDEARELFEEILDGKSWSSFGYIATEEDFPRYFD